MLNGAVSVASGEAAHPLIARPARGILVNDYPGRAAMFGVSCDGAAALAGRLTQAIAIV